MSDEPSKGEHSRPKAGGIWVHLCEHPGCKEWGGFGFSLAGRPARWYCGEHNDEGERLLGRA